MIEDRLFKKITLTLFIVVVIFLLVNLMRIFSEIKKNDRLLHYYVDQQKKESDSIIKAKQVRIKELLHNVYRLNIEIQKAEAKIDLLDAERKKIQYIYINKLKEINKYDAKQIEEYWKNEFE